MQPTWPVSSTASSTRWIFQGTQDSTTFLQRKESKAMCVFLVKGVQKVIYQQTNIFNGMPFLRVRFHKMSLKNALARKIPTDRKQLRFPILHLKTWDHLRCLEIYSKSIC